MKNESEIIRIINNLGTGTLSSDWMEWPKFKLSWRKKKVLNKSLTLGSWSLQDALRVPDTRYGWSVVPGQKSVSFDQKSHAEVEKKFIKNFERFWDLIADMLKKFMSAAFSSPQIITMIITG